MVVEKESDSFLLGFSELDWEFASVRVTPRLHAAGEFVVDVLERRLPVEIAAGYGGWVVCRFDHNRK